MNYLKHVFKTTASNLKDAPLLIRWAWYDWLILIGVLATTPYSIIVAIVWLSMKLAMGEDFRALKDKEKAFYYYQQELQNAYYKLGVLKRMTSVRDIDVDASADEEPDEALKEVRQQIEELKRAASRQVDEEQDQDKL